MTEILTKIVIVPGWFNSGPGHWQTIWADSLPNAVRVEQKDWAVPTRTAWVDMLGETILRQGEPVIVVSHSLGCITTLHLPHEVSQAIAGALLVAPADPTGQAQLTEFAPVPTARLPYPSLLVASTDDPFCALPTARDYARQWGSDLEVIHDAGHINVDSGFGDWPQGTALLHSVIQRSGRARSSIRRHESLEQPDRT